MMSNAWKCRCATLVSEWRSGRRTGGRTVRPAGWYDTDYTCEAKRFFAPLAEYPAFAKVGGWVIDCHNWRCESNKNGRCTAKGTYEWCDQCIWGEESKFVDKCTCNPDLCPFFKARTADEWRKMALAGRVPLVASTGKVRDEGLAAKRLFGISDEDFADLVRECRAAMDDRRKMKQKEK